MIAILHETSKSGIFVFEYLIRISSTIFLQNVTVIQIVLLRAGMVDLYSLPHSLQLFQVEN